MIFVELPAFTQQKLFDDEGLRAVQAQLLLNPDAGDLIPGAQGLRKLRAALSGRDKRGGARVIYYWQSVHGVCYLVFAYAKNRQENLTPTQARMLAAAMTRMLAAAMKEVLSDE